MSGDSDKTEGGSPSTPRKFTLNSGDPSKETGRSSLKIGGGGNSESSPDPSSKPLQFKSTKPSEKPNPSAKAKPEAAKSAIKSHPDIQLNENFTPADTTPGKAPEIEFTDLKKPGLSGKLLLLEGFAAAVAITFTLLIFQDLLPHL